jgi:hypothetical protein
MAGYVTSTRTWREDPSLSEGYNAVWHWLDDRGSDYFGSFFDADPSIAPSQTVTSWRSKTPSDQLDELDNALTTASTEAGFVQNLANQYSVLPGPYDRGHTFSSLKKVMRMSTPNAHFQRFNFGTTYSYIGPVIPDPTYCHWHGYVNYVPPDLDLGVLAAKAIRNTIPTNPITNLYVSLGEIYRDGLPKLPLVTGLFHKVVDALHYAGDQYLNYVFGWKPTVSDTAAAMYSVSAARDRVRQIMKDNGKTIRRSFSFPEIVHFEDNDIPFGGVLKVPISGDAWPYRNPSSGHLYETVESRTRVWFKGAYSYFIPVSDGVLDELDRFASLAQGVLGVELTPEALWKLQPWSWFSDWIWNIGTLVHNLDAFSQNGLVLRYGYLMVETTTTHTATVSGLLYRDGSAAPNVSTTYVTTSKQRLQATPYGFGSNPGSWTDQQWNILGALGLSKFPAHFLR